MSEQTFYALILSTFLIADIIVCLAIKYERSQESRQRRHDKLMTKALFAKRQNPQRGIL
ncbi:MAG: hypothetical protein WBI40_07430 [Methylococcaceae bacterium]